MANEAPKAKYPGIPMAIDGNTAVIMCERESSDAAGAYPITPSTQMGEYWAEQTASGHLNVAGRPLIFIEPEGEHAAAGVTAGLSMSGLRASNFSSGQGIAYMHESLYAAVGKRLPYLLNIGCRAITKSSLNVHAGHDDYHLMDDTGFFQVMAKNAQEAADLNLISRKVAELSLTPGAVGQDGFLTTHLIETLLVPERELVAEFLGKADDIIDTPTPAQRMLYGDTRRRVPILWDVDNPVLSGPVQNQDAYMQSVAAQRPYFFDHIEQFLDQCMREFTELTGREYSRVATYRCEDAEYLIVGQGSLIGTAEAVADYLREQRGIRVGVVNMTVFRPFPSDLLGHVLKGKQGVVVLERTDQPLAEDLPLIRETRACISKCLENGGVSGDRPYPKYATYNSTKDAPLLYSGCCGLGSRDLQPEGVVGAVENMLPDGGKKRFFYLSVDFFHKDPLSPKTEIHQEKLLEAYPNIKDLAIKGSENPNLLPEGAVTVRMHSVGGWGAITTGKNLAITLYDLLGYDIKANPKYGSEKKGQPTTYYLSAAPEPIRINCEYHFVDAVLSPDPNVFSHTNPLFGLKQGGAFIIQSEHEEPARVWESFPYFARKIIIENDITVCYLDAFKIAEEEATDPELFRRMQGIAFQGAFFAGSTFMKTANLSEKALFEAIRNQVEKKFGSKGARVVEDNMRVVARGFQETKVIEEKPEPSLSAPARQATNLPLMLKRMPPSTEPKTDIHRFWEQTGAFYAGGRPNDNLTDPFIAMSLIPANTGVFRDMTQIRFSHPVWDPEKCTACSDCFTICPDSAIPGLVTSVSDGLNTALKRVEQSGHDVVHLPKALRNVEKKLRKAGLSAMNGNGSVGTTPLLEEAISEVLSEETDNRETLQEEFGWFREALGEFKFSFTRPYFEQREKDQGGSGGLFAITVNPYTCKGCNLCVDVCDDDALREVEQTEESIAKLQKDWEFWQDLPNTSSDFIRIDDLDEKIGALETMLLDKSVYNSMTCGDGSCTGCGEKSALHIFTATVTALMQRRVKRHLEYLNELISKLEKHVKNTLADNIDLSDTAAIQKAVEQSRDKDLRLSGLTETLDEGKAGTPIDSEWLTWVTQLIAKLKDLKWRYESGPTNNKRANLGFLNATGCSSVYGSTYPFNPYPFPWSNHLFQDAPSVALGVFEGHMRVMADGFKAIRQAEAELEGGQDYLAVEKSLQYFGWSDFTDEEYHLCPPVVAVGGDGAMFDIGFQNISRALMTGKPLKILVLDTQVYSNTGGQACTSGYVGQVSDMAPYGKVWRGKEEIRKEISLIAAAHRTTFVLQGNIANYTHLIEGFIDGLNAKRPALFTIYTVCQPEHGVSDDGSVRHSKLALESRAYPVLRFDPDRGETFEECIELGGNPAPTEDWPTYQLKYIDEDGSEQKLELPMTFADFAVQEGRFRKHFRVAPRDTWNDSMLPIAEFIDLDPEDREGMFPYIWAVDKKDNLVRVLVSAELVRSTEDRRDFWRKVRSLAGTYKRVAPEQIAEQVRTETAQKLAAALMSMLQAEGSPGTGMSLLMSSEGDEVAQGNGADTGDYEPVWIEQSLCSSCDECVTINPKIFKYDDNKKAYVVDPRGGPFKDIVRAAEKCSGRCIHPGTPFDPNEQGLDKLIKRAAKFN